MANPLTVDNTHFGTEKRLGLCLFFCRLAVFIIFSIWAYIKLARPEDSIEIAQRFYMIANVSETAMLAFGLFQLVVCLLFVAGLFKTATRLFFLALSILAVSVPEVLKGYVTAMTVEAHPTILYFTGFCLLACAFAVYTLRDYDTFLSMAKGDAAKWKAGNRGSLDKPLTDIVLKTRVGLSLFFCRLGVFTVFFVWTYTKLVRPEHGAGIMSKHYFVGGVSESLIFLFGVFEMGVCFLFLLGFYKRFTRGFFLFISVLSVMTPRVLNGYRVTLFESTFPTTLLFSGFSMLACAFALYYLRDLDTRFSLAKADRALWAVDKQAAASATVSN